MDTFQADPIYESFDAPQFVDLLNEDINEEYCQAFFDKRENQFKHHTKSKTINNINNYINIHNKQENINNNNYKHDSNNILSTEDLIDNQQNNEINSNTNDSSSNNELISSIELNMENLCIEPKKPDSIESFNKKAHKRRSSLPPNLKKEKLTSEEKELLEIEQQRKLMKKLVEKNAKNVLKIKQHHNVIEPTKSMKLTVPQGPTLATAQRAENKIVAKELEPTKIDSSQKHDLKSSITNDKQPKSRRVSLPKTKKEFFLTKPLELLATQSEKIKSPSKSKNNIKNCSQNESFTESKQSNSPQSGVIGKKPLTIPQSFKLSKTKSRVDKTISSEQREYQEINSHPKFKARPFNKSLFKNNDGTLGIPAIRIKPKTTPIDIKLNTATRCEQKKSHHNDNKKENINNINLIQ